MGCPGPGNSALIARRRAGLAQLSPWDVILPAAFIAGSVWTAVASIVAPYSIGAHGAIYSDAARAWLQGGNPWLVGPPNVVFAGPPTMLLPFLPTAFVGWDAARLIWFGLDLAVAVLAIRRLRLRAYWILFPPLSGAIILGHPEVLVMGLILLRGPLAGLAAVIKPYVVLPLVAERRWRALAVGAAAVAATAPFLPWPLFLGQGDRINATLALQNGGDSAFGNPLLMMISIAALAVLGPRRMLWFAVPLLWPYAQPIYKVASVPLMPPLLGLLWAIPIPGFTLAGVVALAMIDLLGRRSALPRWLSTGIAPASEYLGRDDGPSWRHLFARRSIWSEAKAA